MSGEQQHSSSRLNLGMSSFCPACLSKWISENARCVLYAISTKREALIVDSKETRSIKRRVCHSFAEFMEPSKKTIK